MAEGHGPEGVIPRAVTNSGPDATLTNDDQAQTQRPPAMGVSRNRQQDGPGQARALAAACGRTLSISKLQPGLSTQEHSHSPGVGNQGLGQASYVTGQVAQHDL